jgi:hypothetical protein
MCESKGQDLSILDSAITTEPTHPGSTSLELPVEAVATRGPVDEVLQIAQRQSAEGVFDTLT